MITWFWCLSIYHNHYGSLTAYFATHTYISGILTLKCSQIWSMYIGLRLLCSKIFTYYSFQNEIPKSLAIYPLFSYYQLLFLLFVLTYVNDNYNIHIYIIIATDKCVIYMRMYIYLLMYIKCNLVNQTLFLCRTLIDCDLQSINTLQIKRAWFTRLSDYVCRHSIISYTFIIFIKIVTY